mgnify:CR=1 FL=1
MFPYTKAQLKAKQKQALERLVKVAGGRTHLARMLGKPLPTINSWINRGMISEEGANLASNHDAFNGEFPVEYLRPDLEV